MALTASRLALLSRNRQRTGERFYESTALLDVDTSLQNRIEHGASLKLTSSTKVEWTAFLKWMTAKSLAEGSDRDAQSMR